MYLGKSIQPQCLRLKIKGIRAVSKGLMIILDGLGDRPNSSLHGQTPLQAAKTPVMDKLLATGSCGLVDPLSAGFPVDTHTGSAALMGVARSDLLSLARGPVEAAGIGVDIQDGDVLLRANFATLQDDACTIIDRRAGRISIGTDEFSNILKNVDVGDGVLASLFPATQHRAVIRLTGKNLSAEISDTDPCSSLPGAHLLLSHALDDKNNRAHITAQALNRFLQIAYSRLKDHPFNKTLKIPANALLTRGAGISSVPRNLLKQLDLKTAVISGERTMHGLARLFGFDVIYQTKFTAVSDTDLKAKFDAVNHALVTHDMVYLHIKATDIFSHNKDPSGKCAFIEAIDDAMGILNQENLVIAVSGDHSTDSTTGNHCGDPVPSFLHAAGCRIDSVKQFSESGCLQGGLGRIKANGLFLSMLDHMGKLQNYHPFDAMFLDS